MERKYLRAKRTILLCGESDGGWFKRRFTIVKKISVGGSAVCYEAYHGKSGIGVLKEFYPEDAYALERTSDGQLVHAEGFGDAKARFERARKEYLQPYEMLLDIKQKSEGQDLSTFIPAFEIYYGCDEKCNIIGSTYIWEPVPKLETFDQICDEIHKQPEKNPEFKLVKVLTAIESLTDCIYALHQKEMLHRDIKPSNFGFRKRGDETLTQSISLFDINSICWIYDGTETCKKVGTAGYMAPEVGGLDANNLTDIYSIGATLFHAVVVTDEAKAGGYLYQAGYYDRLQEMIDDSRLIRASEANSHPRLRHMLATILHGCLNEDPDCRYQGCEDLREDLKKALYYALPSEFAKKSQAGEKWVLTDAERSLDKNREKNSLRAIQYHLYQHPLYQCVPDHSQALQVMVIGFGNYGQKFLDACLQVGQLSKWELQVTVISNDKIDREIYLSARPALADFFDIDGSQADSRDIYGRITFETVSIRTKDQQIDKNALEDYLCDRCDSLHSCYAFIALGDDDLNLAAAEACREAMKALEIPCVVSFAREDMKPDEGNMEGLLPVCVNEDMKNSPLYPEIERMALNTHLVWEKNLNIDHKEVLKDFRKPYNHDSCVSNVLSLKYKLYSFGIDLEKCGFDEAAKLFEKPREDQKDKLIWIEHRRWVAEKLCLGWKPLTDLNECVDNGGMTKDERTKRHICIRRSCPDQKLAREYSADGCREWDIIKANDLSKLDDLDSMSVKLHQVYMKKAKQLTKKNLLSGDVIDDIRTLAESDKKAFIAFQEWYACLKDIWNSNRNGARDGTRNGTRNDVRMYKGLKNAFLTAAGSLPAADRKAVREQVKAFEVRFYPILGSMEYRDWKQDDTALIENIPFVLTYSEDICMAIPYRAGTNSEVFENVAAATVVNPGRILYLCWLDEKKSADDLLGTFPYVLEYMNRKHFRAAVELILISSGSKEPDEEYCTKLAELGKGRIRQIRCFSYSKEDDLVGVLEDYLKRRQAGKRRFAVEKNGSSLSRFLAGAGFYEHFPYYRFDTDMIQFSDLSGCEAFRYIRKTPFLTVRDMTAFKRSYSQSIAQPEFFADYETLWRRYNQNSFVWKTLCGDLGDYAREHDVLGEFDKREQVDSQPVRYRYLIPFICSKAVVKILRWLEEKGVVDVNTSLNGYTTESCEVIIYDKFGQKRQYDKLFSRVYLLMDADAVWCQYDKSDRSYKVGADDLTVVDVPITNEEKNLLDFFQKQSYITNYVYYDRMASFTYATRQIKELLTVEGKMLEVFTYHKIRRAGWADDIVSGYEVLWEEEDVKNEFDCIVTKGFRSLFIECKARAEISQDFYHKINALAQKFGINATAVLVADTRENPADERGTINVTQRKRGKMMGVVTIWKPDEIIDIDKTLLKVLEGTYISEEE